MITAYLRRSDYTSSCEVFGTSRPTGWLQPPVETCWNHLELGPACDGSVKRGSHCVQHRSRRFRTAVWNGCRALVCLIRKWVVFWVANHDSLVARLVARRFWGTNLWWNQRENDEPKRITSRKITSLSWGWGTMESEIVYFKTKPGHSMFMQQSHSTSNTYPRNIENTIISLKLL